MFFCGMEKQKPPHYIGISGWMDEECGVEKLIGYSCMEEENLHLDGLEYFNILVLRRKGFLNEISSF